MCLVSSGSQEKERRDVLGHRRGCMSTVLKAHLLVSEFLRKQNCFSDRGARCQPGAPWEALFPTRFTDEETEAERGEVAH